VKSTYTVATPTEAAAGVSGSPLKEAAALGMNGTQSFSSIKNLSKDSSTNTMASVPSEKNNGSDKKAIEGSLSFPPPLSSCGSQSQTDATYMAHPKAIQKFIRYFAINIISSYYAVPAELESALIALTDNVIYRFLPPSLLLLT
jgi:hypothetical protein